MKKNQLVTLCLIIGCCFLSPCLSLPHNTVISIQGVTANTPVYNNIKAATDNAFILPLSSIHTIKKANPIVQRQLKTINDAMKPFGYFNAKTQAQVTYKNKQFYITLSITPGKPIKIEKLSITISGAAKTDPSFIHLIDNAPIQQGQILETQKYKKLKKKIKDLASQKGYFDAIMTNSQITINYNQYTASINIALTSGNRYHFGKTTFSTNPFIPHFLEHYLTFKEGQPFNRKKLQSTQKNLEASGYFQRVTVLSDRIKATHNQIPIQITLALSKRQQYLMGLGYGTDTGARATLGMNLKRINSRGHRFTSLAQLTTSDNVNAQGSYLIPGANPATELYSISAGYSEMKQSTGNSDAKKLALGKTITHHDFKSSLFINFLSENYNLTTLPYTKTQLIYPNINVTYKNSDNLLNPTKGISSSVNVSGTLNALSTESESFFQIRSDTKVLIPIESTQSRVLMRLSVGHTSIHNSSSLPLSLQLFAGGANSIRAYSYNSLLGKNLGVASFEFQQKIYKSWYAAGFIDAGNASDGPIFSEIKKGTGPGIVWLSPIGMVELDLAYKIENNHLDSPRIQFSMGAAI